MGQFLVHFSAKMAWFLAKMAWFSAKMAWFSAKMGVFTPFLDPGVVYGHTPRPLAVYLAVVQTRDGSQNVPK